MRRNFVILLLFFSILVIILSAFQQPSYLSKVEELQKIAEQLEYNEAFDSAAVYYEKARNLAWEKSLENELSVILNKELIFWTARTDLEIPEKRKKIATFWNKFHTVPKFRQFFYDAQSSFFLYEMKLDSFQFYAKKTLAEISKNKDWVYEVNYYIFLAQQFLYADDFISAVKYIKKAESSSLKCKDPKDPAILYFYFVSNEIYNRIGDNEQALKFSLICLEVLKKSNSYKAEDFITALISIAVNYDEMEDFENGLKYYNEALKLQLKTNKIYEASNLYENMGACFLSLNRLDEAYNSFKKAVELSLEGKNPDLNQQLSVNRSFGDFLLKTNRTDSALICVENLLKLHKKTNNSLDRSYEVIGRVYTKAKEFKKARYYYKKAVHQVNQKYGNKNYYTSNVLYSFATMCLEERKFREGLGLIQKAIYANTTEEIDSVNYKSNPALKFVSDKDLMMNELRLKSILLDSMRVNKIDKISAAEVFEAAKATADLLLHINQTVNYKSKLVWLNNRANTYFQYAIYYALLAAEETKDEKYKEEAFLMSERSRSILLYESLQEKTASRFAGVPDSLIEKENELRKYAIFIEKQKRDADNEKNKVKIAEYDSELFEIQQEIEKITALLRQKYPSYYQLKYPELKINPNDIMSKLGDSTVMIEYFQGKNRSFVFVLRKNSFDCHQVLADSTVNNRVLEFQKLVSDLPYAMKQPEEYFEKYKESAIELYHLWLKPYLNSEDKGKRLVIINDGSLSYLPFEALLTTDVKTKNPNYKSLPYLLKDYTINYDYSAELWLRHQQSKKQINGRVYAMAPTYSKKNENSDFLVSPYRTGKEKNLRSGIGELPGAEKELKMLKNRYKGFYPSKMIASEKTWKENAHEYGILHFAMHGLIDEKEPEFSSLVFTEDGNKEEDNFLYAYEIKHSKLNASLVVLSACETGAGKYQRGEGVLSIGRGFMYAGVPSIVMTLWKLNDQSASELIGNFYTNLEAGQQKDKALQEAKIKYLETSNDMAAHPALWACFIQLGDYSAIKIEKVGNFNYYLIAGIILLALTILFVYFRRKNKSAFAP